MKVRVEEGYNLSSIEYHCLSLSLLPRGQQHGRMKAFPCPRCYPPVVSQQHGVCLWGQIGGEEGGREISMRREGWKEGGGDR